MDLTHIALFHGQRIQAGVRPLNLVGLIAGRNAGSNRSVRRWHDPSGRSGSCFGGHHRSHRLDWFIDGFIYKQDGLKVGALQEDVFLH